MCKIFHGASYALSPDPWTMIPESQPRLIGVKHLLCLLCFHRCIHLPFPNPDPKRNSIPTGGIAYCAPMERCRNYLSIHGDHWWQIWGHYVYQSVSVGLKGKSVQKLAASKNRYKLIRFFTIFGTNLELKEIVYKSYNFPYLNISF